MKSLSGQPSERSGHSALGTLGRFWSTSIRRQLILGVACVHVLLMTVFIQGMIYRQEAFLLDRARSRALHQAQVLAAAALQQSLDEDLDGLAEIVTAMSADHTIGYAMVMDDQGQILAHTDRSQVGKSAADEVSRRLLTELPSPLILRQETMAVEAASPMLVRGGHRGWARVSGDLSADWAQLRDVSRAGVLFTCAAILLGGMFAVVLAGAVTRPLRHLLNASHRLARDQLDVPIPITTENEVGQVARAFNYAMARLAEQRAALNSTNEALRLEVLERKRAEEELRHSEHALWHQTHIFRILTENASAGLFMLDSQGRCTFMNPSAERISGYEFSEMKDRKVQDIIKRYGADGGAADLERCSAYRALDHGENLSFEEVFIRRDGTPFPAMCTANPIVEDGVPVGTVIEVRDITAEKQARSSLLEADRRKDEFLAMLAHELRNPLAPIQSALQLIRRIRSDSVPSGRQLEVIDHQFEIVERQAGNLTRLVDDLLDVSRITRGKIELRVDRIDVGGVVVRAIDTVRGLIDYRRHRLEIELPEEPVYVNGDSVRLEQAMVNLLTNAAKYTDPYGVISVSVRWVEDWIELKVRDTGTGIAPEKLDRVFNLFEQGDQDLARAHGGLGIGLTIVRRLVEMHGGEVRAYSGGPGKGSEFTIRLPVAPEDRAAFPPPGVHPPEPVDGHRRCVLVVDDNADAAETLAEVLMEFGHEVRVAHDGPSALEVYSSWHPEVVFLDIGLPGMDGYEVARRMRASSGPQSLLVALTGYGQESDRRRSHEVGIDQHLVKPVQLETILRVLETAVTPARVNPDPQADSLCTVSH